MCAPHVGTEEGAGPGAGGGRRRAELSALQEGDASGSEAAQERASLSGNPEDPRVVSPQGDGTMGVPGPGEPWGWGWEGVPRGRLKAGW